MQTRTQNINMLYSHICSVLGFEGRNCETDVSECDSSPCLNEGTCIERSWKPLYGLEPLFPSQYNPRHASGFICKCPPGFSGISQPHLNFCFTHHLLSVTLLKSRIRINC